MLDEIVGDFADTVDYTGIAAPSKRTLDALRATPRERYVPEEDLEQAYVNRALGIGYGQTISQPFIVALMTEALEAEPDHRVLEIGTGSGWQAAVLAQLVERVYTVEIVPELAASAAELLEREGLDNVEVRAGDGWAGWPEAAPFDAIIVTAAGPKIPPTLLDQLKPGGRLIMPVGQHHQGQTLTLVTKAADGELSRKSVLPVIFVPLTGGPAPRS